jgi:ABC-type Fe3+-hydroxamate transport system substrate-binding protein
MIKGVGEITGRAGQADQLANEIIQGFASLTKAGEPKRVAYFIWRNPWMTVGGDTFINDMIEKIGWQNVLADKQRYPEIMLDDLSDKKVELVLLSSEPYPFKEVHIAEIKAVLPDAEVMLVDGEMFSWYGSRMKEATGYLKQLITNTL